MILNSVALPDTDRPLEESLHELRRIYRRMCLLRATGRHAEALDLEIDEFNRARSAARAAGASEHQEAEALAQEVERVANATILAELLAPLLAEKLQSRTAPASATAAPASVASAGTPTPRPSPATPAARPPVSNAPSVTDLIDGMLSQRPAFSSGGAHP